MIKKTIGFLALSMVFVTTSCKQESVADKITDADLNQSDDERANYSRHFTKKDWRDARNYHMTLDSSLYGSKESARKIVKVVRGKVWNKFFAKK